jgi:hypothetical protein
MSLEEIKQLTELQQQEHDKTISMRTTSDLREKRKIEAERNILHKRIQKLETKIQDVKEKEALEELNKLLIENRYLIFLSVNGSKIEIPTDLKPEITFQPCEHKQKIFIGELLRNRDFPSNQRLLDMWKRLLSEDITTSLMLNCETCRKEKESKLVQWGIREDKPNGRANLVLRRLQ